MGRLADRGVVHVQVVADRSHEHLAGVDADADLHLDAVRGPQLVRVAADGVPHAQRRVARADGVVLEGEGGAEERHDPVAHDLVHRALVAVDGLHHELEDGIEEGAGLLGVALGDQLHRSLDVREEHGHLLALALERGPRREDVLGEVPGRVGLGRGEAGRRPGRASCAPHEPQNLAPAGTAAPHEPQAWARRTPQLWQNRDPSGFSSRQRGQFMRRYRLVIDVRADRRARRPAGHAAR